MFRIFNQIFQRRQRFLLFISSRRKYVKRNDRKKRIYKIFLWNESKIKKINLDSKERFIKNFKEIAIDITIIEILSSDEIEKECFLLPMIDYIDEFKELKNEEIFSINYQRGKISYLTGKIKEINKYSFTHSLKTENNSFGLPIFLKDDTKVIGVQKKGNEADFIGPIFNFLKNLDEKDNIKINIKSSQINKEKKKYVKQRIIQMKQIIKMVKKMETEK